MVTWLEQLGSRLQPVDMQVQLLSLPPNFSPVDITMNSFTQLMEEFPPLSFSNEPPQGPTSPDKQVVKVTFDDGDYLVTTINGSREEVNQYYMGKSFTKADESSHTVSKVEFISDGQEPAPVM